MLEQYRSFLTKMRHDAMENIKHADAYEERDYFQGVCNAARDALVHFDALQAEKVVDSGIVLTIEKSYEL